MKNALLGTMEPTASAAPMPAEPPVQPLFATIDHWMAMTGMGRRTVYEKLGTAELRAIKSGTRTLIDVGHGLAWLRSLPPARIRAPRDRRAA